MGKIAFVFAGQGAQKAGMGREIYARSPAARRAMDAAERIRPGTLSMCFDGPDEALTQTVNTQPCVMLIDYACALAAAEAGIHPDAIAGFSLGELAAAAFSGMLSFEDAFRLTVKRAALMQACADVHPGAMGAVLRLTSAEVEAICAKVGNAYPVNYNCPGQTVVACAETAFDELTKRVAEARGRVIRLKVSGAFHTPWMREAADALSGEMAGLAFHAPITPIYANVTARPYDDDPRALLAMQVCSPVRWAETIRHMADEGVDTFVEVGPGTTLTGLIKKTAQSAKLFNVEDDASLNEMLEGIDR